MEKQVNRKGVFHLSMISFFLIQTGIAVSQVQEFNGLPQFLFPEFSASRIKMKAGKDLNLILNYNLITEKMVFFQKEQVYDMLNQINVDTIFISGNRFIPYESIFYEVYPGVPYSFFIQHRGRILSPPKPAAYGGTSELSSSTYMSRIELGSQVYNAKLEGDLRVKYDPVYWARINNQMISFTSEKQYLKLFPGKEEVLKQFIKKNRLKFEKQDNLLKLWNYTNQVSK
jgi:hypothetical protein